MSGNPYHIPTITAEDGARHAHVFYHLLGHEPFGVTELRALGRGKPVVAYADNAEAFVRLAMQQDRNGAHVYAGLQPRPCALFECAPNAWRPARGRKEANVARAADIEYVTMFGMDIDVDDDTGCRQRPASVEELDASLQLARRILEQPGFAGAAAVSMSGNGCTCPGAARRARSRREYRGPDSSVRAMGYQRCCLCARRGPR